LLSAYYDARLAVRSKSFLIECRDGALAIEPKNPCIFSPPFRGDGERADPVHVKLRLR
jgi:hypothetical protein